MVLRDKKGFFFVLSIFLILSYLLMSLSIWTKSIETSEKAYAEIYKESNVELAITELSNEKVGYVANLVMQRAVYDLGMASILTPLKAGEHDSDQLKFINQAMKEYFINGTPSANNFVRSSDTPPFSKPEASFGGWIKALNESLQGTGVSITKFNVSDFTVWQERADGVNYSIKLSIAMSDKTGSTTLSRDYQLNGFVNITGYVDPAIARESAKKGQTIYRRFFFGPYQNKSDLAAKSFRIHSGQGWFYGYVVDTTEAENVPELYRPLYILMGSYEEIVAVPGYENFSAYIVVGKPIAAGSCTSGSTTKTSESKTFNAITYSGPKCDATINDATRTEKPFVVVESEPSLPECFNLVENKSSKCALIVAGSSVKDVLNDPEKKYKKDGSGVFDIEALRDFTMCGYYIQSDKAPSYLQRFFANAYSYNSSYGIETFVIGEYANSGSLNLNDRSALDREMFGKSEGDVVLIRGGTGCKSEGICSVDSSTGKFGLTNASMEEYGVGDVSCENGGAGCEE